MRGREVGIEGAGSGDRGGGKRGSSTPLSTPTTRCSLSLMDYHVDATTTRTVSTCLIRGQSG